MLNLLDGNPRLLFERWLLLAYHECFYTNHANRRAAYDAPG